MKKLLTAILATVALAACGTTGGQTNEESVLVVAQGGDPVSLDPHRTNDRASTTILVQIYEQLVAQTEDYEIVPMLAESWEFLDERTIEFQIRQGVLFHNGDELKASDVAFTLRRALEAPVLAAIVGEIDPDSIEVTGEYSVKLATFEPFAPLLANLSHHGTSILSERAVTEAGEDFGLNPIGTGPFQFVDRVVGDSVELERFPDFHGDAPLVDRLIVRTIIEPSNRLIELETGTVDIVTDIAASDINRVEDHADLSIIRRPATEASFMGFNLNVEPFNDIRVRHAINLAIDVDSIVASVLEGVGEPMSAPIANIFGVNDELEPWGHDVEQARALMSEAGLPDGFSATLISDQRADRVAIAQIIANQLQEIGIELDIQTMEWGTYLELLNTGNYELFMSGWVTVNGDADQGLFPLFHSTQHGSAGNRTFFANDEVDRLLSLGRASHDTATRLSAYHEAQAIIVEEAPWLFLNTSEVIFGINDRVQGLNVAPNRVQRFWNVGLAD